MPHLQPRREHLRRPGCPKSSTFDEKQTCSKILHAPDLHKQKVMKTEWKIWDTSLRARTPKSPTLGNSRMRGAFSHPYPGIPCPGFGRLWRLQRFGLKPTPITSAYPTSTQGHHPLRRPPTSPEGHRRCPHTYCRRARRHVTNTQQTRCRHAADVPRAQFR